LFYFLRDLNLKESTLKKISESNDPPGKAICFMITRAVKIHDLLESLISLNLTDGLFFLHNRLNGNFKSLRLLFCLVFQLHLNKVSQPFAVTLPLGLVVKLGQDVSITPLINGIMMNSFDFEFAWFKYNERTEQSEHISQNPTHKSASLIITGFELKNVGNYQCYVSRKSTSDKIMSNKCELFLF
jgi:hypothetical protein